MLRTSPYAAPSGRSALLLLAATLGATLFLAACETVVEVEPPPHDPQLVPVSFFTPDAAWAASVSHTVAFTDTTRPGYVENATVEVWDGARRVQRLPRVGRGLYAALDSAGLLRGERPAEATYTLRVTAPGYPATEGRDALPLPLQVTAFRDTLARKGTASTSRRRVARVEIALEDPPGPSFYGVQVYQLRLLEDRQAGTARLLPPALFPFESKDPALGEGTLGFLDPEASRYVEAFFTDELLADQPYTLDFEIQYDEARPGASSRIQRVFVVLLIAASEHFYRYWTSASEQRITGENPFAEPLRVHSNMSGGLGVFAGFRYRIFPLRAGSLDSLAAGRLGLDALRLGDLCAAASPPAARSARLPLCQALYTP